MGMEGLHVLLGAVDKEALREWLFQQNPAK